MKTIHLEEELRELFLTEPANRLKEFDNCFIFFPPVTAVAAADDELFLRYKDPTVIGAHHLAPREWLPEARSVISYFLPFSFRIVESNGAEGFPSEEWVYGRIEGEAMNDVARRFVVDYLSRAGGKALAPSFDPRYRILDNRSTWSERHAAYAAGLGTFSLSRNLITAKGCAGRFGSVITDLEFEPTPRRYSSMHDNCNFCGDCIKRCPAGAITSVGKDVERCSVYIDSVLKPRFAPRYGCGKCQTRVSCSRAIP